MVSGNATRSGTRPAVEPIAPRLHSPAPSTSTLSSVHLEEGRRDSFMAYENQHSNHFHIHAFHDAGSTHFLSTFFNAILATALFRCWHILVFYLGWATMVTLLNEKVTRLTFQPTLLTVVGTVLGFVISYRTTSSFERYNEGRRYWSQIILASRTLARTVWFHVPELPSATPEDEKEGRSDEERRARNLIEKKTVINLIEAFAVAVKHYLRGEEGIAYVDLYHLVKFLPSYAFPAGVIPTEAEAQANIARTQSYREAASVSIHDGDDDKNYSNEKLREASDATTIATGIETRMEQGNVVIEGKGGMRPSVSVEPATPEGLNGYSPGAPADGTSVYSQPHVTLDLPLPATAPTHRQRGLSIRSSLSRATGRDRSLSSSSHRTYRPHRQQQQQIQNLLRRPTFTSASDHSVTLLPASLPPKNSLFDVFPFSLLGKLLATRGKQVEGKKAAKLRAKAVVVTRNVPLEISMYLTSYVATLGARKAIDVPTNNLLILSVNQLTDALTGLERILTTPIPFSYSIHLWLVTIIYNLALPFQIYPTLRWLTIPASGIMSFIFFGFLVAGEEIENPFGYDKNDLNMDHFTHNIIRNELRALTAFPPPSPESWAFSPRNDRLFAIADPLLASHVSIAALNKEDKDKDTKSMLTSGVGSTTAGAGGLGAHGQVGLAVGVPGGIGVSPSMPMSVIAGMGAGLTPEEWIRRGTGAMKDALARAH
ncbi:hypothetical protein ACEPAG_9034 [Sanghuangporus baumii]